MVVGPSLIAWANLHPASASATAMFISLLNATTGTITMLVMNKLNIPYAVIFSILCIIGTVPGIALQHWLVKKTGRASVTVTLLTLTILFAIISNLVIGLQVLAINVKEG
jgi:uncharacterized membrane protein YfcA